MNSAEDIRVVIEPRSRTVDANLMMESLFRLSELEARISMNMNVLTGGLVPRVLGLNEALREWLDHRRTCCCGARASVSARSSGGWKSCAAC